MITTRFTELVGCAAPLQQAGMGGVAGPELAGAVAAAGGLGMVGAAGIPADVLGGVLDAATSGGGDGGGAVGVNLLVPFLDPAAVEVAAERVAVVEAFYGDPDPAVVATVHAGGALAAWQVGSVDEARAAVDAGCDLVVAQGVEAGGHVRGTLGVLPLLDGVLAAVDVPVVAAGGIGTGRGLAAVLAAGADAGRVGTRFVAAAEADAHPRYVDALVAARPEDTVLTTAFSVLWPDAPHRVLRASVEAAHRFAGDIVGESVMGDVRVPVPRFGVPCPGRDTTGAIEAMPHYAGQSVGAVTGVVPAAAIVAELLEGTERLLAARS